MRGNVEGKRMGEDKTEGKKAIRRRTVTIFIVLLFLFGLGMLLYPVVANQWNTFLQQRRIVSYNNHMSEVSEEDLKEEWEKAREYNENLGSFSIFSDVFDGEEDSLEDTDYWNVLNVSGDGIMGYLSIPAIDIRIPIYHGTGDEILKTGVGHLSSFQLPIGGEGNHTVLAAHRGLPSSRLFSDLDQLEAGDMFYLYILDEILAYQVDQILPMVEADDMETLSAALAPVEKEDYVTLFTCTPYGVNSHRLLVRGHRVDYVPEEEPTTAQAVLQAIQNYYMLYLLLGLAVTALGILVVRAVIIRGENNKANAAGF